MTTTAVTTKATAVASAITRTTNKTSKKKFNYIFFMLLTAVGKVS